jgi:hypothetical protein
MSPNAKKVSDDTRSANAKANFKGWHEAVKQARKALNVKGFVAVKKGTALYKKAKEFYGN